MSSRGRVQGAPVSYNPPLCAAERAVPMELIRGLINLRERHRGAAITIGGYDGLHVGHRALVEHTRAHAARVGGAAMMVTFEPLPKEYLQPNDVPARLTNFRERWRLLQGWDVDLLCVLAFGPWLRNLSGEGFFQFLRDRFRCSALVVGHDFRFGREGAASVAMLEAEGARNGMAVEILPPVLLDGVRVSSTGVREALATADFARAASWLGRPYTMRGRVVKGARLGRTLGFPTANMRLGRLRSPLSGIFAVRVHGTGPAARAGVASLGTRPTVNGIEPLLETFLFDFDGDLYGMEIEVEFVAKLREELKFANLDALTAQMQRDASAARALLEAL